MMYNYYTDQLLYRSTAMDNFSLMADNCSEATCNSSDLSGPLPLGAVAFAPIFFLEMVASLVSNTILLALVLLACVHKFNNNINIYLFSVSLTGLMGAFNTFCAFTLVVARRWVLSGVVCALNSIIYYIVNFLYLGFYLIISRDKYNVVKHLSRPSKKRAYLLSAVIWIVSVMFLVPGLWQSVPRRLNSFGEDNLICFGPLSQRRFQGYTRFVTVTVYVACFWIISTIVILMSFVYFVRIILELRKLNKLRLQLSQRIHRNCIVRINEQDRPIYTTGEERTAKSFALVYFIHLSTISISYAMSYIQIIRNFVLPPDVGNSQDLYVYLLFTIVVQLFTATNPVYLILSNKRLRMRVKGLFKCELNPNTGDSPAHTIAVKSNMCGQAIKVPKKSPFAKFYTNSKVYPQPV